VTSQELLDALADERRTVVREEMTTPNSGIAQRVGPDTFLLRGRFVTGDELTADAERAWARDDLIAQLDRDTGVALTGLDVHRAALEILAARGLADDYTDEQYIDACTTAGAR
jgi:hypothetical protein